MCYVGAHAFLLDYLKRPQNRIKKTKFPKLSHDFAPNPIGRAYSAPQTPQMLLNSLREFSFSPVTQFFLISTTGGYSHISSDGTCRPKG